MRPRLSLLLLFVLLASLSPAVAQRPDGAAAYARAIADSRTAVQAHMAQEAIPGVSVAVMIAGRIVWSEGFGFADLEQRVPVTPLTKMRIGSVSKPMTSAAVGVLMDAGRLDLDAPVQTYVPSFPAKAYPITTRQIAGHIAGIRHYRGNEMESAVYFPTVREGLALFENDALLFPPGERYAYSSYGWNLVSAVVEGASGEPFLAFMQREVFDAMSLRHTTAEHMDSLIAYRSRYYVHDDRGRVVNAPYVDNSYKWAGGGFVSTAEDVVRFGHAMRSGAVVRRATAEALFATQHLTDGTPTNYGIGWRTGADDEGRRTLGHTGGSVGGTTRFTIYPDEDLIVCVISNLSNTRFGTLDSRIAAYFFEGMLE